MIESYPAGLPCPQSSSVTEAERRALSDDARPRDARLRQSERIEYERLSWPPMPRVRCQILLDWWRDELIYGGAWFTSGWPSPRGPAVTLERKFLGQPSWQFIAGGMWRISALCEVRSSGGAVPPPAPTPAPSGSFVLMEDGSYVLTEDGDRILME